MLRPLRITVSVGSALCCLLVIVLWVRSYGIRDSAVWPMNNGGMEVNSIKGRLVLFLYSPPISGPEQFRTLHEDITPSDESRVKRDILGFSYYSETSSTNIHIHFLFLALATVAVAGAPWIRWSNRFSLRTLLLATTAIALALGLIIYATRG
jgi:hypothetical protein